MKVVTKNTDYAVRALLYLAKEKKRFVSSREISRSQKIPLSFLRRILQALIRADIIVSKEGIGGGVKLKKSPSRIKLLSLITLFQGHISFIDCVFRKKICCNIAHCPLRRRIETIEKKVTGEFGKISLQTLFADSGGVIV